MVEALQKKVVRKFEATAKDRAEQLEPIKLDKAQQLLEKIKRQVQAWRKTWTYEKIKTPYQGKKHLLNHSSQKLERLKQKKAKHLNPQPNQHATSTTATTTATATIFRFNFLIGEQSSDWQYKIIDLLKVRWSFRLTAKMLKHRRQKMRLLRSWRCLGPKRTRSAPTFQNWLKQYPEVWQQDRIKFWECRKTWWANG